MTPSSLPQTSASFTGNKLKRKMSQGTSKQSHFLRTEITHTPNSRVYRHSCAAETFAQLHKVSLYREKPRSSRREEGTEVEERRGRLGWGAAQVTQLVSPAGSPGFHPRQTKCGGAHPVIQRSWGGGRRISSKSSLAT